MKYGLVLPQQFIDHVMSDAGTAFLESYTGKTRLFEGKDVLNLLPDNFGDISLDNF